MIEPLPKARSIWVSAASRALDLSMDEPSTTRRAAAHLALHMAQEFGGAPSAPRAGKPTGAMYTICSLFAICSFRAGTGPFRPPLVPFEENREWSLFDHHSYRSSRSLWSLIGAHAVPSVPKESMKIRLFGALLCGGLLVLVATTNSFAQSGRNNTVQGNYIGTSRGVLVSPYAESARREERTTTVQEQQVEYQRPQVRRWASRGDNNSPRPQDRKANKAGSGTGKAAIFDRWGRTGGAR